MACCSPLWYCTPYGVVKVLPDADGHYTKPPGYTGGPYETEAEAWIQCPALPFVTMCSTRGYTVPGRVSVALVNPTGCLISNSKISGAAIPYGLGAGDLCGFTGGGWCGVQYNIGPIEFTQPPFNLCESLWVDNPPKLSFRFYLALQSSGGGVAGIPKLTTLPPAGGAVGIGYFPWDFTPNTGWNGFMTGSGFPPSCIQGPVYSILDQTGQFPLFAGTLGMNNPNGNLVGTVDVYITA